LGDVLWKRHHVQAQVGLALSHLGVILELLWTGMGYVDARTGVVSPVLGVESGNLDAGSVDAPGQVLPEHGLDQPFQALGGILVETTLVENDFLAAIFARKGQLLEQVRQHIGTPDVDRVVSVGRGGTKRNDLGAAILNGDLHVAVGIFLLLESFQGRLDKNEETATTS
jgi:hypothetical protein